uniref:ATP synthase F0 subunit 8 n=1 Tax=Pseudoniphargus sp. 2-Portugal TaxID=2212672 RepID=A0A345UE96_9CRUS|nr:ATP synthase F0 subunit 8 [Pseudoniphargus sp. 2-Portugal]
MPQMAPMLWLLLFISILIMTYFIMNLVFFTLYSKKNNKKTFYLSLTNLYWKW